MSNLGHQYDNSLDSNAFGFLRQPMNFQPYDSDADWVITGEPFDMATSGRPGGRHGPAAIRQVSTTLAWEHNRFPWYFDMRERLIRPTFGARRLDKMRQHRIRKRAQDNNCAIHVR